jgi:hypothetical protein
MNNRSLVASLLVTEFAAPAMDNRSLVASLLVMTLVAP